MTSRLSVLDRGSSVIDYAVVHRPSSVALAALLNTMEGVPGVLFKMLLTAYWAK
jgi:hypothetical protein